MNIRVVVVVSLAVMAAVAAGCSSGSKKPTATATITPLPTAAPQPTVTGTTHTLADGLAYIDIAVGTGAQPSAGKQVSINYSMYVHGLKVGGTTDKPMTFVIGHREALAGIDEGVSTMRVGGRRRLLIPAKLAYGAQGLGQAGGVYEIVPPNTPIVVDVTLISAQ